MEHRSTLIRTPWSAVVNKSRDRAAQWLEHHWKE